MAPALRLATCLELPERDPDAAPLEAALTAAGVAFAWAAWDDPAVDWDAPVPTLLRTTWNYSEAPAAFAAWCDRVAAHGGLTNPAAIVRGNMHKRYLLDLAARGVPAAPTVLVDRDRSFDLASLGWDRVVIKPAISAGSRGAAAFDLRQAAAAAATHLATWSAVGDVLVQPFIDAVRTTGERSLVWLDGEFTHSIRKAPRFAGEAEQVTGPHPIADDDRSVAQAALAPLAAQLLYARVDLARDANGHPLVMELELIEPSLFLAHGGPQASARLVAGVQRWLATRPAA